MQELADSMALVHDTAALRTRLGADGYLFFRGLLPASEVRAAGQAVAERLAAGGWIDARGRPLGQPRAVNAMDGLTDPAFRAALASPGLNKLPYRQELRGLVRRVLGAQAFSYPGKVLRAVYPQTKTRGRYVHCDYLGSGVQDMLTTWLPLMDVPMQVGGLAVQPGGQLGPPRLPRLFRGPGQRWASTGYRPGDVIVFHCLTPHAALPNHSAVLRLSTDVRWQLPDRPVPAEVVFGPHGNGGQELFSRLFGRERWWEPVPSGLTLLPRQQLAGKPPGPSMFFPVHPGWQRHRPDNGIR
jgi:hypothetical protein